MPVESRFEHCWILAPQGTGKSQLIQYLVSRDLPEVAKGNRSVVIIDSQGDLIRQIRSLEVFHPDVGELAGKLIVIEPDPEHPPALNPFDITKKMKRNSPRRQEQLTNSTLDLLTYAFGALGDGAEMTPKQSALYRYCIRLLLVIPGATLQTFSDILANGVEPFQSHIATLEGPARDFFQNQFNDQKLFGQTKQEVAWRLALMMENAAFARMFNAPVNKLDLFEELNSSKVILINTDKALLGEERTNLFGRYFIALLLAAAQERADSAARLPVFVYVDEAQDYIATDSKVTFILDQARKMKIGMTLANQRSKQISNPNVLDALLTTSIKLVHTDNDSDTHLVARYMKTRPEVLSSLPKKHFALHIRNHTPQAVPVEVPFFVLENAEHLSKDADRRIREDMRERYSVKATPRPSRAKEPPPDATPPSGAAPTAW